jgi:hypothetical protein
MYPACCHGSAGLNDSLGSKLGHVRGEYQCSDLEGLQLPTPGLDDSVLGWDFFSTLDRYSGDDPSFHTRNMLAFVLGSQSCLNNFA